MEVMVTFVSALFTVCVSVPVEVRKVAVSGL